MLNCLVLTVFASRIATLMGPVIFGVVASSWNMKIALLTVIPFFAVGVIMLLYLGTNFKEMGKRVA